MVNRTGSPLSGNKVGLVLPQSYKMQLSSEKWIPFGREQIRMQAQGQLKRAPFARKEGEQARKGREGSGEMQWWSMYGPAMRAQCHPENLQHPTFASSRPPQVRPKALKQGVVVVVAVLSGGLQGGPALKLFLLVCIF